MAYTVALPDGRTVEFPDEVPKDKAGEVIRAQFPEFAPKTTIGGYAKEALKGIPSGAVGMLESAAVGASALLPTDLEKKARAGIADVATAAKAPFAAAPGYEESIPRKAGEALGSTAPFFALGPFGLVGRAGATALAVGAGAGEARVRAEEGGATEGQRGTSTLGGAAVGTLEMLPVFKFIDTIGKPLADGLMSQVRRAFATGGAEAAQEATSQILQNLIAKGQYKPDQALLEGSGEAAAYGGGIGALIQGITDLAIGRRAKGGKPSTTPTAEEIPPVTPAPAAPDLAAQKPEELILAAERLKQQPVTPEQAAQLDAIREELRTRDLAEVATRQKVIEDEAFAAKEAAAADAIRAQPTTEMQQVEMRAAMPEEELPPQLDLFGKPLAPAPDQAEPTVGDLLGGVELTTENMQDAGLARTPQELEALGQQRLPLRRTPEGKPTTTAPVVEAAKPVAPAIPEPILRPAPTVYTPETAPTVLGPDTFKALGIGPTAVIRKAPIVGLDITDPANAAQIKRDLEMYREGRSEGIQAKIDRYLARPEFKTVPSEPVNVQPPSIPVSPAIQAVKPGGSQPSVEVPVQPVEPARPAPVQPAAAAAPAKPAETVGLGLAPAGPLASTGTAAKGTPPAALTRDTAIAELQQRVDNAGTKLTARKEAADTIALLNDPTLNETPEDKASNLQLAAKVLGRTVAPAPAPAKPVAAKLAETATKPKVPEGGMFGGLAKPSAPELTPEAAAAKEETDPRVRAIKDKSVIEVADWAAQNLPDSNQRLIATRVAATLRELQKAGLKIGTVEVTAPDRRLRAGKGVTSYVKAAKGDTSTVSIKLNHPANEGQSGTTAEVILHELVHAATMGTIHIGGFKSAEGTKVGEIRAQLLQVSNAVINHFNNRIKTVKPEDLTEFERTAFEGRNNAFRDMDEILAWSLSNTKMQKYMESIPYKGANAWDKFVTLIRDMLGLSPKTDTALSEVLRVGGALTALKAADLTEAATATGKQFAIAPSVDALVDGAGPINTEEKGFFKRMIQGVQMSPDVSYATKFRTQVADIAATIEMRFREQFDGAVRNSLGNVNPMGLYRQAQDYTKMLLEYFQQGAISKDPVTGLWIVETKKGIRPPKEVYDMLKSWGEANGKSFEDAKRIASRILEGVRLAELRTQNATNGTNFPIHKIDKTSALDANQQIDEMVAEYARHPELKEVSAIMDKARIDMVDHMVAVGRLTPEQGKDWKAVANYVPFDRMEEFATKFTKVKRVSGKGLAQVGKLPELVGSFSRPVGDVFENYFGTLGWMVGQVIKTDGTVQTLRSLQRIGMATDLKRSTQDHPNAVGAYVNGEMNYWGLPSKYDVMAFKDLNAPKANWLLQLGAFSNVLRKAITILPPFALKQVTDDVQRAIMTSGVKNPGALLRMTLTNFPKLALAELRGIQHPTVREFGAMGLTGEYDFQTNKPAQSLLKDLGFTKRGRFEGLLHRLDGITRASDLAVRKAIYEQTLKEGGDKLLAQTRAREFINFRRRGNSEFVGAMVTTIPFFNAYVQGMDVLYRAASGLDSSSSVGRSQARKMFWSRAAIATMMASLYALGKDDEDEDYKNMDLRTRDSNWILPGGLKLPVPGELGAIFKVIPERVVEYMRRQGTPQDQEAFEAVRTALTYMYEQYVGRVTPIPQAAKPLIEAWANKSFLTGKPLEGFHQQTMDPSARVGAQTSELAIAIANFSRDVVKTEVSPIMIDNALRGYFGSTAALFTAMTDSLLNPTRVDRPLHKWALLSTYMYDPVGTRTTTEFYEEREKMGKANATLNSLMKTDTDRAVVYAEEHQSELAFESAINSTLEQLQRTRAYRTFLNSADGAKAMPTAEREEQLLEIRKMEVELTGWVREAKTAYRQMNS